MGPGQGGAGWTHLASHAGSLACCPQPGDTPFPRRGHCRCHLRSSWAFLSRQLGEAWMLCCVPYPREGPPEDSASPTRTPSCPQSPPAPRSCPWPARLTMMQLGLLMDHRLTRQSSPPVASSRPEPLPSTSEDTLLAWATISTAQERAGGKAVRPQSGGAMGHVAPLGHQLWHKKPLSRALPLGLPCGARTALLTPADK